MVGWVEVVVEEVVEETGLPQQAYDLRSRKRWKDDVDK